MSKMDENEIRRRLEQFSQIEPSSQATDQVIERLRDTLTSQVGEKARTRVSRTGFGGSIIKLAAAAVLLISLGYLAGRLSAPEPLDVERLHADLEASLKSSLEPTIRQDLLKEMDRRWKSVFAASCVQLRDQLHQQVRHDLTEFASQTLAASTTLTDRRLVELIQLIEAARMQDRRRVEEALELIELNRLQDKTSLGKGLQTLVAQTAEWRQPQQN
jgi:hypothetical protein